MFSFFRRQKKTDKKQKGQQSGSKLINDIQCVPVEKYEIAFTKKPQDKPAQSRSENCFERAIMGSIESSPRKPEEKSASAVKYNDYNHNDVTGEKSKEPWTNTQHHRSYQPSSKDESSKVSVDYSQSAAKEVKVSNPQIPPVANDAPQKATDYQSQAAANVSPNCQPVVKDISGVYQSPPVAKDVFPKVPSNYQNQIAVSLKEVQKASQESPTEKVPAKVETTPGLNAIKPIESTKENVQTEKPVGGISAERRAAPVSNNTRQEIEQPSAEKLSWITAKPDPSTDNQSLINDDIKNSTNETTETRIKQARDMFFSVEPKAEDIKAKKEFQTKKELQSQSSVDEMEELEADQFTEIAVEDKDPSPGDDTRQEHSSEDHTKLMDPFSESQYSDSTRCSVDRFSESGRSTDSEMRSDDEEEFEEAQSKAKLLFRPTAQCGEVGRHARPGHMQIPDITITESSDSEGENESENDFEMECYRDNCYERTFPTILYDITEVDEPFSDASDMEFSSYAESDKRNVVHQESKFQDQIKSLKCDLETKDSENMQLRGKINDLQRDIMNKTWGMDRLHAELESFQKEADCVRKKLLKVEEDLNCYKVKNSELNEQLLKTLENETDVKKVSTLQSEIENLKGRIRDQNNELEKLRCEKLELQAKLLESETDKREKIKTMEIALDETLKQKQKLQAHFEEEYEKLRTVHSDREQQLLDDFEWKLREVELTCKRKLEDKDKSNEDKIKLIKETLENEIAQLKKQLKELEKIKSYEAEVSQLRGLTQEQERSLKMAMRTTEQCHLNERSLNEEIDKLRSTLEKERNNLATVQNIHSREISEKDRKYSFKLEQQKNELNTQWEDKIRRETLRLKLELEKNHREEKRSLQDEAKSKSEEQLKENEQLWEKKLTESKKELEILEQTLEEKEETYRTELLRLQTNSDRDMLELRRKLDKMDLSYQEKLEKKQEKHEQEIDALREEYEKKIQQSEQNWSQQISTTRATLELVKEQLQRESEMQMEDLNKKYMQELEEQYEKFQQEKEEAVNSLQEKYNVEMYELQNKLGEELKFQKVNEEELKELVQQLQEELQEKSQNESELQENINSLQETIVNLQEKISSYQSLNAQSEATLKNRDTQYNTAIAQMKERYEKELKDWHSKLLLAQQEAQNSDKINDVPSSTEVDQSSSTSNIASCQPSKSSRRKNRGRHRNQRNVQNQKLLEKQFSSSSL